MVLQQTQASCRFLTSLTKFEQVWLEDYQILIPTTIHGLKLELERPRYHKNWGDASIDAPLTSKSHNFWFNHCIFKFYTFLEIEIQDISKGVKINSIKGGWRLVALQGPPPQSSCRDYK